VPRHISRDLADKASEGLSQIGGPGKWAKAQYQTLRSVSDVHVFVLCYDGSFYERVPEDVRKQGPWQGTRHGDVEALKPEYRLALARDRYVLVKCEEAVFNPET
jgi:hypothetical protein